jgi:hypothetical protein
VLGNKPLGRWGAGLMLDPSDNLYVIGGTNYHTETKAYSDLSDLYIFQLRDPFYKYCSATGVGLQVTICRPWSHGKRFTFEGRFYLECHMRDPPGLM